MNITQGVDKDPVPRLVGESLRERLEFMPAVVVTGARQTGKSTLVRDLTPGNRRYLTLDDLDLLGEARRDPAMLLEGNQPITLDEVQREPKLLHAVKQAIDRDRRPGRFLLTGSANLLLMRKVSESLAGRASHLTLWPMTRSEQRGLGRCGRWDDLVAAPDDAWLELLAAGAAEPEDWRDRAYRGGFPTPALALAKETERAVWFDGYVRTYLERDLLDLSAVAGLPEFRRLMRAACYRLGRQVNQTQLGRDISLPQPTVRRYLNLLETSYLLVRLPAYSVNRTKRLMKSPKLYFGDLGVALSLSEGKEPGGAHLENLVLLDLLAWRDAQIKRAEIFYWRTTIGEEVDLVIEQGGMLLPIEIKATTRPRAAHAKHLRTFRAEYAGKATAGLLLHTGSTPSSRQACHHLGGLLLHTGSTLEWIAPHVLAVPWWRIL